MSLILQATSGKITAPHLVLLYGPEGVGKTSFGAAAPKPFFICSERGTDFLDVTRFKPKTIEEAIGVLRELAATSGAQGKFKTVVLDSLDWLEPLVWKAVCKLKAWSDIETPGYGKGYIAAMEYWQEQILPAVNACREAGLNVVLIAHAKKKSTNDIQHNETYERFQLKLDDRAAALWKEYVDTLLFATFEVSLIKDKGDRKAKAYGDGDRVMYTERRPWVDAKNRQNLPFELPLSWESFEAACSRNGRTAPEFQEAIAALLLEVKDEGVVKSVQKTLSKAGGDTVELARIENKLKTLLGGN